MTPVSQNDRFSKVKQPRLKQSSGVHSRGESGIGFLMDLPPPPPVNYYRHDYPPPYFHRLHFSIPSPLHPTHPPLPSSHLPGPPPPPPQFYNFIPPRNHHEIPRSDFRVFPTHDHHNGDSILFGVSNHLSDSRADLQPPEAWLDQRNQRHGPFSSFRPHNERIRNGLIDEGLRGASNREFQSRGSKDNFFYPRNEVNDSKHTYPSGGNGYPANFLSHSNLSSDSQLNLGNRPVYDGGDKKLKQKRQVTSLELLPGNRRSFDNNGARCDKNMTGEKFNGSPKKMKAQRKRVSFRLQSRKVESKIIDRSHEEDGFVRAQVDELMPTVADSHAGKGKKAFVWSQRQLEEKREKGTMELQVSIKSNALVAKPIMATSSPVAASINNHTKALVAEPIMAIPSPIVSTSKSSMAMNIEFDKTDKAAFPPVNSSEETLKTWSSGYLPSLVDEGSRKLKENVNSDDRLTDNLNILSGLDKVEEGYVENASAVETREFDGKVASYGGFPHSSLEKSISGGNSNSKQTQGLVISNFRSSTCAVSGGSVTEIDTKRKRKRRSERWRRKSKGMHKSEVSMAQTEAVAVHLTDEKDEKLTNVSRDGPSCFDTGLSRKSREILVEDVPSLNAGLEDGLCEDNLMQNKKFTNLHSVSTNGVTFLSKMQSEQDCIIKLSDTQASGGCITDDLRVLSSSETLSKDVISKLPNNASIVITTDSSSERLPNSMVSGLDVPGNPSPKFDLLNVKKKIDVRDDKGSYHAEKVLGLGSTHSNASPSPVLGEFDMLPDASSTEIPFNSEKSGFSFTPEEHDTSLGCKMDPLCSKGPSSVVYTTCSAPSGDFCGSTMGWRPDKLRYVDDVLLEGVPEQDMEISSPERVAGGPEESCLVSSTGGGPNPMNTTISDDRGHIFITCDMNQKLQNIDVKGEEHLLRMKFPSSAYGAILQADDSRNVFQNAFKNTNSPGYVATTFHNNDWVINNMSNMDQTAIKETEIAPGSHAASDFEKPSLNTKPGTKLEDEMVMDLPHYLKNVPSLDGSVTKASANLNPLRNNTLNNKWLSTSISSNSPDNGSVRFSSERKRSAISHVAKPRTWHRNGSVAQSVGRPKNLGNLVSSLASAPQDNDKVQNSYVRKGNSLLRKPSAVVSDILKDTRSIKVNVIGQLTSETKGGPSAAHESPEIPPIGGSVPTFDPAVACTKPATVSLCQTDLSSNSDGLIRVVEGNNVKKITYVKRKSNQLVAASSSGIACVQGKENAHVSSSDGYFKRRKNQLVRTSSEDDVRQRLALPHEGSLRLEAQKNAQDRSFSAKQSGFRQRKRPAVWMRHGSSSFKKQRNLGYFHSLSAFYIPWKKSNSWSNLKSSLNLITNEIPVSTSRRLLLSKKRDAIYERSRSGFSLCRSSNSLNVGRRSLKWSKSMERSSKRANEDATLAEKRKTEQSGAGFTLSMGKNLFSRERIFRIGLERYKMDPAGKILQRISDENTSCSEVETESNSKKLFLPRRLLIGNGEYVRIGNGNQLIRDPKQRTRVLATEKVRRSLHTARLRLAKKTCCQFFTRYGKCKKDGKKCPYIHDPSKVAVCSKYLSASCHNPDCKLTHKVIPERMQDCSYFLQGLCSNESCPYRHVNVNPKSSVCEDFLRGYCADGNECRKRHTYVCPIFEATGSCDQGSKCKLHHPRTKKKATLLEEKKTLKPLKNSWGRYFTGPTCSSNNETTMSEEAVVSDVFSEKGKFSDYVSLGFYNDESNQEDTIMCDTVSQVSSSDLLIPEANLDEMIKPFRIMNQMKTLP